MIVVFGSLNVDLLIPVDRLPNHGETVIGPGYSFAAGGKVSPVKRNLFIPCSRTSTANRA